MILNKMVFVNGVKFKMATMILIGQFIMVQLLPRELDLGQTIPLKLKKVQFLFTLDNFLHL